MDHAPVTFLRIVNPKKPGEFLILAERDFDPAVHTRFWDGAPALAPAPRAVVAAITDVNAEEAKVAIAAADLETLEQYDLDEQTHPKYAGGRKAVIDAIAARRKALAPE